MTDWEMANIPNVVNLVDVTKMTHLIYGSIEVTSDTDPTLYSGWGIQDTINRMLVWVNKGHAAGIKVGTYLYDGGTSLKSIVASPSLLSQLAVNIKNFLVQYNLDGIELDWEIVKTQAQMDTLINALYSQIQPLGKEITIAGNWYAPDCSLTGFQKISIVNMMTYDMYYYPATSVRPIESSYDDTVSAMMLWVNQGYDRTKLAIGIPSYGNDLNGQAILYGDIVSNLHPPSTENEANIATINSVTGIVQSIGGNVLWWNGLDLVRQKCRWAIDNGFGGVGTFSSGEDSFDPGYNMLQAIYDLVNTTKFGLYGNLAPNGMVYNAASVTTFTQLFDWGWLTPPYPYNNPYYGSTIKAAGRRNILRCSFWDAAGIYPTYQNWTQLRAGGTAAFNAAVTAMSAQINSAGAANLYGYSMYEEEPADAYGWVTPTQSQIADFIYCVNTLYTLMKAAFPSLPIMQNPHIMGWFTDAQLQSISFDLLEVHSYSSDLPTLQAYLQRGLRIANGKEMFTLLYCGTSASYDPPGDPTYLAQAVAIAGAIGVTNIGIYCYRDDKPGSGEQIIFNTYTEPSPPPVAWVDPYLHYQAIMAVITKGNFQHGTSHTASFSVTVAPSGITYQVEVWLTSDGTTKSATTGLKSFTSTGSAQAMVPTITMPAAGTYQVYKDIYINGALEYRFSDNIMKIV
jgi:hypothetical protein